MGKFLIALSIVFGIAVNTYADPAIPPYDWDIVLVGSDQYYVDYPNSDPRGFEYTEGKNVTTGDHGGFMRFYVLVRGGYYYNTYVLWNNGVLSPSSVQYGDANGDQIVDLWLLEFEVNSISEGNIEVRYGGIVRDYIFVR